MSDRPTLVFGDGGTETSDVVWLWINGHRWTGWRLEVLTVHRPERFRVRSKEESIPHPWDPPHPRVPFESADFAEAVQLLADTDPRLALSVEADLVVIGPRGPGLLKSLHLGSTAEWLLQHPSSPVLVVRHGHPVRTVLLCTDGSPHARRVTRVLASLPWIGQVDATVLAVRDDGVDAEGASAEAAALLEAAGASVTVSIVDGEPTPSILDHLSRGGTDLVALGTRGLTGLPRLRMGSTASAVTRTADSAVLVACVDEDSSDPDPTDEAGNAR